MQNPNGISNKSKELIVDLKEAQNKIVKLEEDVKIFKTQIEDLLLKVTMDNKNPLNDSIKNFNSKFKYKRSFLSRLIQGGENLQSVYTVIKNYILKYKGVKNRNSWGSESFYYKRSVIAKLSIKGKSLYVFLALNEKEIAVLHIDEKVKTVKYQNVPAKIKVTGNIKLKRTFKAIDVIMARLGLSEGDPITHTFYYDYESDEQLLNKGLIKPVKDKIAPIGQQNDQFVAPELCPTDVVKIQPSAKPKKSLKNIFKITFNVFTYAFFILCLLLLALTISSKKDVDGAINIFGKQMRVVLSNSMEKCDQIDVSGYDIKDISVNSMIFIELVPESKQESEKWYANLKVGDVLTFKYLYVSQETITHRITKITEKIMGGYVIELAGDNKSSNSNTLTQTIDTSDLDSPNYVIGKVTGQSYFIGFVVTTLKSPIGALCLIAIPALLITIIQIVRLISAVLERDRKLQRKENEKRDEELEGLRKQIEVLMNSKGN